MNTMAEKKSTSKTYIKRTLQGLALGLILIIGIYSFNGYTPWFVYNSLKIRIQYPDDYTRYRKFDLSNIDDDDIKYVADLHRKYGQGPIDVIYLKSEVSDANSLMNLTYFFGHRKFTDKDLFFCRETAEALVYSH
jgi:hypothetical protein